MILRLVWSRKLRPMEHYECAFHRLAWIYLQHWHFVPIRDWRERRLARPAEVMKQLNKLRVLPSSAVTHDFLSCILDGIRAS